MNQREQINIMTWNATGVMTGIPYLDFELKRKNINICGLSEHWLLPENANLLNTFNDDYISHVVINKDVQMLNSRRIGKGGVGFIWKRLLNDKISVIDVDDDRIAVIKLFLPNEIIYLIQVYLPTITYRHEQFTNYIDKIIDLYSVYAYDGEVIILGDFNANIANYSPCVRARERYLREAISQLGLKVLTVTNSCSGPRFLLFRTDLGTVR